MPMCGPMQALVSAFPPILNQQADPPLHTALDRRLALSDRISKSGNLLGCPPSTEFPSQVRRKIPDVVLSA
jgi:hypothetical protein